MQKKIQRGTENSEMAKALCEGIAFVVLLAVCFVLPSFASLFEGSDPEWNRDEIGRHRRVHWPLLKDPDSLLCIQAVLRMLLFALTISFSWKSKTPLGFGSTCSSMLFLVSYLGRAMLFGWKEFHLEGPIGGKVGLMLELAVLAVVLVQVVLSFCGPWGVRGGVRSCLASLMVVPVLLTVSGYVGMEHFLNIAPGSVHEAEAMRNGNALFSFVHVLELFATLILLGGPLGLRAGKSSNIRRGLLVALATTQSGLSLLYFLDSFDLSPQSTLAWGAQIPQAELGSVDGKGRPLEVLVLCESLQFGVALLCALFHVWDTLISGGPSTEEDSRPAGADVAVLGSGKRVAAAAAAPYSECSFLPQGLELGMRPQQQMQHLLSENAMLFQV